MTSPSYCFVSYFISLIKVSIIVLFVLKKVIEVSAQILIVILKYALHHHCVAGHEMYFLHRLPFLIPPAMPTQLGRCEYSAGGSGRAGCLPSSEVYSQDTLNWASLLS
jgi:hypothetical protein